MMPTAAHRLLSRLIARSLAADRDARRMDMFPLDVDGVRCSARCEARVHTAGAEGYRIVEGECSVLLSCRDARQLVAGFGWMRFWISERSAARTSEFFDWALHDACEELRERPEFMALREGAELARHVGIGPTASRERRARL